MVATAEAAPALAPPAPPPVRAAVVVDYSGWVYPVEKEVALGGTFKSALFGELGVPVVVKPPPTVDVNGGASDPVPLPLPPDYIVFGGARYASSLVKLPRPLTIAERRRQDKEAEAERRRLQFMVDQLDVARHYLKAQVSACESVLQALAAPTASPTAERESSVASVVPEVGAFATVEDDSLDLSGKANLCTVAYAGTPPQLHTLLEKHKRDGTINQPGSVSLQRRQWGLKRVSSYFVLGLGMKATPLQFAAVAGRLDNVVVLLGHGARDSSFPTLKDILSAESYEVVSSLQKRTRAPRASSTGGPPTPLPATPTAAPAEAQAAPVASAPLTVAAVPVQEAPASVPPVPILPVPSLLPQQSSVANPLPTPQPVTSQPPPPVPVLSAPLPIPIPIPVPVVSSPSGTM